jgi:putative PIN family toxin of toxin-antitoxin system
LKSDSADGADRPEKIRVVIDTCALVAARFSPEGAASRLLDLCIDGRIEAVISDNIERENLEIVSKVRPPAKFRQRLRQFHSAATRVASEIRLDVVEDPADNKYLECAQAGHADCIVTSDRHLLVHDGFQGIRICKAGSLVEDLDE